MSEDKVLFISNGARDESATLQAMFKLLDKKISKLTVLLAVPELLKDASKYTSKFNKYLCDTAEQAVASIDPELKSEAFEANYNAVHTKHPTVDIVQKVIREQYNVAVKQAEPRQAQPGFDALDMSLLRKCPQPLWLLRPALSTKNPKELNIAVAIDPMLKEKVEHNLSISLLTHADQVASNLGVKINIISCWHSALETANRTMFNLVTDEDVKEECDRVQNDGFTTIENLIKEAGIKSPYEIHHNKGEPTTAIPEFTRDKQIDVLLMGTVARTGITGFIFGNTAENILHQLDCSVIAVKPPGFVSPIKL